MRITKNSLAVGLILSLGGATSVQADPEYKADVPDSVKTPDSVRTKLLGELEFTDGFPSDDTVKKTYDFLDTSRGVELFLNAMPTTSMCAMLNGHAEIGSKANQTVGITEDLMNARSLWLTPQTTTPYVHTEIDVKNGPVVIEIGSPVLGLLNDAYFRYVADIGIPGADKGNGENYLVVSKAETMKLNEDGSATVNFGPEAPEGKEGNWVQTMPNKGFNVLLRLYGPLEPWFDKTWMPGDFELVK